MSSYLNFMGQTEEAFAFYASVFGTEVRGPIMRMGDLPPGPGQPPLPEAERGLVMHMELPIAGGHVLMGTDLLESMGHQIRVGNNITLNVQTDSVEEADRLFAALSQDGTDTQGMVAMPWGYWGVTLDRFSIRWMINGPAATA